MPFGRMHVKIMVQLPKIGVVQLPVTVGGARAGA